LKHQLTKTLLDMGGFTQVRLKDTSNKNIKEQNAKLKAYGVKRSIRFYSMADIRFEYDSFVKGIGTFPEHMFPKDKINSFNDFKKYWNPKAIGEVFCPHIGTLQFDCYFGRTSKNAMRKLGKYLAANHQEIKAVGGSFTVFMERGMTKSERNIITNSQIEIC